MKTVKKRGRPRITGKPREPNGRISRAKRPNKAVPQVTIEMRAKHFGLSIEEAKNPLSSSYIGRLYMLGTKQNGSGINKEQYDTAQRYLQIRNDYLCAKGLPSGYYDNFTHALSDEKAKNNGFAEQPITMKRCKKQSKKHNSCIANITFMGLYNILL